MIDVNSYFNSVNNEQAKFVDRGDQFSQIMLAFLTQNGVMDTASGMVDKAKFQKQLNDTKTLQNQLDASEWSALVTMANAWSR
jgi:hypothetical protein